MAFNYPLMLDLTHRLVVVIGGGAVAARKAGGLLDAGATRVRVVSPAFHAKMPEGVDRVIGSYEPCHLDGAGLVFAVTNSAEVNDAVVRDATARGLLVNRADADDANPGDFATPAMFRQGSVAVTVSAGSPALSAVIRDRLRDNWDPRWTRMAEAMQSMRPQIVADPALSPDRRAAMFRWLATEEALAIMEKEGVAGVMKQAWRVYPPVDR